MKRLPCRLSELQCLRDHGSGEMYYAALIANDGTEFGGVGQSRRLAPSCAYRRALAWAEAKAAEGRGAA
jgi:hypothetical protein